MESDSLLGATAQSIDLLLRELSAFLKAAGGFVIAVIGFPTHVFGDEAALFLALAILFALGAGFGGVLWWVGRRLYDFILPAAERYLEGRLKERLAEDRLAHDAAVMEAPMAAEPAMDRSGPL